MNIPINAEALKVLRTFCEVKSDKPYLDGVAIQSRAGSCLYMVATDGQCLLTIRNPSITVHDLDIVVPATVIDEVMEKAPKGCDNVQLVIGEDGDHYFNFPVPTPDKDEVAWAKFKPLDQVTMPYPDWTVTIPDVLNAEMASKTKYDHGQVGKFLRASMRLLEPLIVKEGKKKVEIKTHGISLYASEVQRATVVAFGHEKLNPNILGVMMPVKTEQFFYPDVSKLAGSFRNTQLSLTKPTKSESPESVNLDDDEFGLDEVDLDSDDIDVDAML